MQLKFCPPDIRYRISDICENVYFPYGTCIPLSKFSEICILITISSIHKVIKVPSGTVVVTHLFVKK